MWLKFLKEFEQEIDGQTKKFEVDSVIEVKDEDTAKSLIALKYAEETKEPEGTEDLHKSLEGFQKQIDETISTTLTKSLETVGKKLEEGIPNFAQPKDNEEELWRGFKGADHFMRAVVQDAGMDMDVSDDDMQYLRKAPSGQNISSDVEGGFAVPEAMANAIWSNLEENPVSPLAQTMRFTTSGNSMKVPRIFESSRKSGEGRRHGGIVTTWLDEADEIQSTKAKLGTIQLELHKLGAVVYFTDEMLEDGGLNFNSFVREKVPEAIAFSVMDAFIRGTGVGKPKGILKEDSLVVVPLESGQGNHTIFHHNVSNMYWRNLRRSSASWYGHPDVVQQLEFMFFDDDTTNKRPVYLPANQVVNSPFGVLYGRPVIPYELMPDFGDQGDLALIDWSDYGTLTKVGGGVRTASSIHVRFLFEETAFRFTFRIDGRSLWTSDKEDYQGDTARSPYTTLASRTGGGTSSGL